jgi:hypothetical protein
MVLNLLMRRRLALLLCCFGTTLVACSPALNWRDVRPEGTFLVGLLPCKPDHGARVLPMGAKPLTITMMGCDANGATFTLAHVAVQDVNEATTVLTQWQAATLNTLRAQTLSAAPFALKGSSAQPAAVQVRALGVRPDGKPVSLQAVWFVAGGHVFQVAMYADQAQPEVAEAYFSGLRLP